MFLHEVNCINLTNACGRTPLMNEIHERTYSGRDGEYINERARNTHVR